MKSCAPRTPPLSRSQGGSDAFVHFSGADERSPVPFRRSDDLAMEGHVDGTAELVVTDQMGKK